jgi:hypothetical protein
MVNSWLKSNRAAVDGTLLARANRLIATKRAHFRHRSCVNQQSATASGRLEVVLDQAILGLLLERAASLAVGNQEIRADPGRDPPFAGSLRFVIASIRDRFD